MTSNEQDDSSCEWRLQFAVKIFSIFWHYSKLHLYLVSGLFRSRIKSKKFVFGLKLETAIVFRSEGMSYLISSTVYEYRIHVQYFFSIPSVRTKWWRQHNFVFVVCIFKVFTLWKCAKSHYSFDAEYRSFIDFFMNLSICVHRTIIVQCSI